MESPCLMICPLSSLWMLARCLSFSTYENIDYVHHICCRRHAQSLASTIYICALAKWRPMRHVIYHLATVTKLPVVYSLYTIYNRFTIYMYMPASECLACHWFNLSTLFKNDHSYHSFQHSLPCLTNALHFYHVTYSKGPAIRIFGMVLKNIIIYIYGRLQNAWPYIYIYIMSFIMPPRLEKKMARLPLRTMRPPLVYNTRPPFVPLPSRNIYIWPAYWYVNVLKKCPRH